MPASPRRLTPALRLESLEGREVPASLQIVFDYRYDTSGFFSDPAKRAILEQAGADIASRLDNNTDLAAVVPAGGNSWSATVFNPSSPSQYVTVPNLSVGTDQIVVFVGGSGGLGGGEAGIGGFGGYSASGSQDWLNLLGGRGRGGFAAWGGSIAFSASTNWYVGTGTPGGSQIDFYTVAAHELGHVLGFGVANQWNSLVSGSSFTGANARAAHGGTNPQVDTADWGHWRQGTTTAAGQSVSMQPSVAAGTRVRFSDLDFAALADIGWDVSAPASPPSPPVVSPPPAISPLTGNIDPVVVGSSNGTFQVFSMSGGQLVAVGSPITPFPGFYGDIRTATGDVNGDGVKDVIVAAGPGGGPVVKVFDGRTGQEAQSFYAYESFFRGGVRVAAGDFNGDGRADVVVGADQGGGPRVRVFSGGDPNAVMADFWGIDDPNFRGGVRVAAGDINGDHRADLVVAAGPGGGPRIAVFNGQSIAAGNPQRLVWDFFAYDQGVVNGAYVGVADIDGDGFGDVVLGPGAGAAHVKVLSGARLIASGGDAAVASPIQSYIIPQAPGYNSGARVTAGDFDGSGTNEIAIGTGAGTGAVYLSSGAGLFGTYPFGATTQADGLFVG